MAQKIAFLGLIWFLGSSCDSDRVFERNIDLADRIWHKDSVITFDFEIEDPNFSYNIYYNIRNTTSYPFYNLYLNHTLENTIGAVLSNNLDELFLFDQNTGEPLGSGMGDIFDHRIIVLESLRFPSKGNYQFHTQQYMRQEELRQIMSIGIRIEIASNESEPEG